MRTHFSPRTLIALAFIILPSTLAACSRPDNQTVIPAASHQQLFQLQGQLQQGPDAGLNLSGELRTTVDPAGRLRGALTPETGSTITVTGQIAGQAIHLSFDLGNNNAVLGVGTLQHSIDNPQGTAGGMLTGPQPGDSGDWFARWTTITVPVTPVPTKPAPNNNDVSPLSTLMTYLAVFLITMVGLVVYSLYRISGSIANMPAAFSKFARGATGRTPHPPSPFPRHSTIPSVRASAQTLKPERWPAEASLPLAQFATIYAHGDDHYDLSFTVETPHGDFLGECGVGISAAIAGGRSGIGPEAEPGISQEMPSADDALAFLTKLAPGKEDQFRTQAEPAAETRMGEIMGHKPTKAEAATRRESRTAHSATDKSKLVTALDVWLFDKNDIDTVTTVLRSRRGFYNPSPRSARDPVKEVVMIEPDQTVVLETKTLRLRVKVIAVEYLADNLASSGAFKQVSLKLAVWVK